MKQAKILLVFTFITIGALFSAGAQTYDGGTLPEVEIRCTRTTMGVELNFWAVVFTFNFVEITCTNGFYAIVQV